MKHTSIWSVFKNFLNIYQCIWANYWSLRVFAGLEFIIILLLGAFTLCFRNIIYFLRNFWLYRFNSASIGHHASMVKVILFVILFGNYTILTWSLLTSFWYQKIFLRYEFLSFFVLLLIYNYILGQRSIEYSLKTNKFRCLVVIRLSLEFHGASRKALKFFHQAYFLWEHTVPIKSCLFKNWLQLNYLERSYTKSPC